MGEQNLIFLSAKSFSSRGFTLKIAPFERELEGMFSCAIAIVDMTQIRYKADKGIIFFIFLFSWFEGEWSLSVRKNFLVISGNVL